MRLEPGERPRQPQARLDEEKVYRALVLGLRDYLHKCGFSSAVLGLSGGIDSTLIVGLMSRYISPVRTFSIGFPDARFDETAYARCAAAA